MMSRMNRQLKVAVQNLKHGIKESYGRFKRPLFLAVFAGLMFLSIPAKPAHCQVIIPVNGGEDKQGKDAPITGTAVLAVLGGSYALKKLRDQKREE